MPNLPNRGPRVNPVLVGGIAATTMFGLLIFAFANVTLFAHTIEMKAQVASGDTLAPNADVEVAGVKVGTVKSIDRGDPGALLTMTVDTSKFTPYHDARLQIRPHGVFGPKFVEIDPGTESAGKFRSGETVDLLNTSVSVDFEQILNELDAPTRTSLQTALYELGTGSEGRGQDLGQIVDKLQVVTAELTPALQVIARRSFETGRLFESNATVTETLAASPLDQIIHDNADVLAKLDVRRDDLAGVVVHGNNVLGDLDLITAGNNVNALRATLQKLPGLLDALQRFNNDLGVGVNALSPVLIPQRGQADSDIGLAIRRTEDTFGECDITDQSGYDTLHATVVKIVPCYDASGKPYTEKDSNGKTHVAHHHVKVLLGLHTNASPSGGDEEGAVICGPSTENNTRASGGAAFSCTHDPIQSVAVTPAGGPPPSLFGAGPATTSGFQTLLPETPVSLVELLSGL